MSGSTAPEPVTPPPGPAGATACVDPNAIGPTPIRRLSTEEYTNAMRDVFQAVINPGQLPADEKLGIFKTNVATRLTEDYFERYRSLATSVSADVRSRFPALSGCASTADAACVTSYLNGAARRLFHGTLEQEDAARLEQLHASVLQQTDADVALEAAVQWMLLSPRFLFLVEFGQGGGSRSALTGSEIAGRLSAFFWRTVPDQALLALADGGAFDTPEGVRTQADAMLRDPRAVPMLESFAGQLLRIIPPAPGSDALELQKKAQVGEIFAKSSTDASLTFAGLIAGEHRPSGSELANFYGNEDRRGVLLTAGFLASNSTGEYASPVKRGYVIRAALLCGVVPPPTDPTDMQLMDNAEGTSNLQELFNAHSNIPECWSCHQLMDPIGDAFSHYTANGGFDPASTSVTAGTLTPSDPSGDFQDVDGLLELLSQDAKATECFALQVSRYALGRNETREDACGVQEIIEAFAASSYSVRDLLLNVASSSLFTNRNSVVAGGQCR